MVPTPPPPGLIKFNVDAVITNNASWIAVVARDENGNLLGLWAKDLEPCDPLIVEASSILRAIQLDQAVNYQDIVIEGEMLKFVLTLCWGSLCFAHG